MEDKIAVDEESDLEEGVAGLDKDEDAAEEVLGEDVVFDVVGVALDAERQQFQDQTQELYRAGVVRVRLVTRRVGK